MRGKRAKRERREIREGLQILQPIAPILQEAAEELESPEIFEKWSSIAVTLKLLKPEIPLKDLLPSRLDRTLDLHKNFLQSLDHLAG